MKEQHIQELKAILNVFDLMLTDEQRVINVEDWLLATRPKLEAIIGFFDKPIIAQNEQAKPKTNKEILRMLRDDYPEFWKVFSYIDNNCPVEYGLNDSDCISTACDNCWEKAINTGEDTVE